MKRRKLYIGISVVIIFLIIGLIGWSIFIGRQQQQLTEGTTDLGFFSGGGGSNGGLFGGTFGDDSETDSGEISGNKAVRVATLQQLYNLPTAGYAPATPTTIRFVDKATGHVFEKELPNEANTRVEQTTIPQLLRAYILQNGRGVIRQYLDEIGNIVSTFRKIGVQGAETIFLPVNIISFDISPSATRIVYVETLDTGSRIVISDPTGENAKVLWSSALRGWSVQWPEENAVLVTQKPSSKLPSVSYHIDINSTALTIVNESEAGLNSLTSPDGLYTLLSRVRSNSPDLLLFNNETKVLTNTGLSTFAEKCVWSHSSDFFFCGVPNVTPEGNYPDEWYQGLSPFADTFIRVEVETLFVEEVLNPVTTNSLSLDMIRLAVSSDNKTIFFINKSDLTLWSITLPEEAIENDEPQP